MRTTRESLAPLRSGDNPTDGGRGGHGVGLSSPNALCLDRGVAQPKIIEFPDGTDIPILYEDRSVLVLDKPAGWLVAPDDWVNTRRNLVLALRSSLENGDWWAKSRNLRFLRIVHRLDAETSGILLAVKSQGAVAAYSQLFEGRALHKTYLAVVSGTVPGESWVRKDPIGPDAAAKGRFSVQSTEGKEAETAFRVLARQERYTLVEAKPVTGRTHQIRLHLKSSGCPVLGDDLYGQPDARGMALRAVGLEYVDPFQQRPVRIRASADDFCRRYGFAPPTPPPRPKPPATADSKPAPAAKAPGAAASKPPKPPKPTAPPGNP